MVSCDSGKERYISDRCGMELRKDKEEKEKRPNGFPRDGGGEGRNDP